jgi:hypothetical protein
MLHSTAIMVYNCLTLVCSSKAIHKFLEIYSQSADPDQLIFV